MKQKVLKALMKTAVAWSEMSTCDRLHVGTVAATWDGVILSSGYNGSPKGFPPCDHACQCWDTARTPKMEPYVKTTRPHDDHCRQVSPCQQAVHSEANCIALAARQGTRLLGSILVCTYAPCVNCSMLIIQAGIAKVYFGAEYRSTQGLGLLDEAGVGAEMYAQAMLD